MKLVIVCALALAFFLPCVLGIYRGRNAKQGQFRYHVKIYSYNGNGEFQFCGGSYIISNSAHADFVLTAASCVYDAERIEVTLAETNYEYYKQALYVTSHEHYIDSNKTNDIALICVDGGEDVGVQLPKIGAVLSDYANQDVTVTGAGLTTDQLSSFGQLKWTTLDVLSNKKCNELMQVKLDVTQMCGTAGDSTQLRMGDEGGPLVLINSNIQIGIASYPSVRSITRTFPEVATRTSPYLKWINKTMDALIRRNDEDYRIWCKKHPL